MNANEKRFKVAVDDSAEFIRMIDVFNRDYQTDFKVESTDFLDGVEFVFISFTNSNLDEIFLLGAESIRSEVRKARDSRQSN